MNLNRKIISLRKQKGYSQEELAERLDVSRQSVSKWESGVSIPDMNKILLLSDLFNVTTDYLLKDDFEDEYGNFDEEELDLVKPTYIGDDEVYNYLRDNMKFGNRIALGVALCILGAISVVFFSGTAELNVLLYSKTVQEAIGLVGLFSLVALAVMIFILSSLRMDKYDHFTKGLVSISKRTKEDIQNRHNEYNSKYVKTVAFCVVSFIVAVVPLVLGGILNATEYQLILLVVLLLFIVMLSVYILVRTTIKIEGFRTLLNRNKTHKSTRIKKRTESYESIYWAIIVATYLAISFTTNDWGRTWIIWPVAGVLSMIIPEIINIKEK